MSNYTKTTNFGAKDTLPSGDSQKIVRGTEFDTEFNAISTAIATKLEVDVNNNLSISGTLSATKIIPTGGTSAGNGMYLPAANTVALSTNGSERIRVDSLGNVGIKTTTPQNELEVFGSGQPRITIRSAESISETLDIGFQFGTDANSSNNTLALIRATPTQVDPSPLKADLLFWTNTGDSLATTMRLDSSGNLGFNFTPSTWGNGFRAIQLQGSSLYANGFNNINLSSNVAGGVDIAGSGGLYGNTQAAARYQQINGAHMWYTAPSGTTGTAITFLQRMVLNNDGHLGLGHSPAFTWGTGIDDAKALQIGDGYASGSIASDAPYGYFNVLHNVRWDGTNWIYTNASAGSRYYTYRGDGAHVFETAPVGTGSTAATLTERLRIRQSGNTQITSTSGGSPVNTADTNVLRLRSTATSGVGVGPTIFFEGQTGNVTSNYGFGAIQGMKLSATAGDYSGGLAFFTQGSAGNNVLNEIMRVTPAGLVIGTTSTSTYGKLAVAGNDEVISLVATTDASNTNVQHAFFNSSGTDVFKIIYYGQSYSTSTPFSVGANGAVIVQKANAPFAIGTFQVAQPLIFGTNSVERVRIKSTGQLRFVPLSADPAGAEAGDVYYNSTSNKLKVYNGTAWVDLH
ncbi:MAG: hypothetical protein RL675_208 [Bacteroidota bacterium]|jgi:hypothetical protein